MNEVNGVRIVTLKDLWELLVKHIGILILAALAAAGGMFAIHGVTYVPAYSSTATLYILRQDGGTTAGSSDSDFSLALKVVNDCDYLLKSHSVLDDVIQELNLNISYKDLSESISTSNPDNTRILEVTAQADSPEQAKAIVDKVCEVGQEKIAEAMGFQQVNLYEYGTLDPKPCNRTRLMTYFLVGFVAAILTYAVYLVIFLLDDRIHSEEDIERYLGLSILGDIPDAGEKRSHWYGYGAYGAKKTEQKRG